MLSFNRGLIDETQEDSASLNVNAFGFVDDSLPSPFEDEHRSTIVEESLRQFPPPPFPMARGGGARGGEAASAVRYSSVHDMVAAHGIVFSTPPSQPQQCDATAGCMPLGSLHPLRPPPTAAALSSHESIASLYPHCLQEMDADFDSILRIDWMSCDAGQVYDVLVSPHMQCGSSKSMAWVLQFAVKQLTGVLSCFCSKESEALKVLVSKGIK
jgi:hypothetical protein